MKQATLKVTKARKDASQTQVGAVKSSQKVSARKARESTKNTQAKIEDESSVSVSQNKNTRKKSVASSLVVIPKLKIEKAAPNISVKKLESKKNISVDVSQKTQTKKLESVNSAKSKSVSIKLKPSEQNSKLRDVSILEKQEKSVLPSIKKQKSQTEIALLADSSVKQNMKAGKIVPAVTVKKSKRAKNISEMSPTEKIETKTSKRNVFFSINKIKVIEKKINLPSEKTEKVDEKSVVPTPEAISIETELLTTDATRKSKPKKVKPIGPAIFRGKKERYAFEVYPLEYEFVDVPAIYVISKRITDKQKRAHHALVCIGQTASISGEIKKHKNKCIKKHNANVISILPEENEKKRLKIEEDLKSAHAIVCNIE